MFITLCLVAVSMRVLLIRVGPHQMQRRKLEDARKAIAESQRTIHSKPLQRTMRPCLSAGYAEDCWIMLPNAPALCGPNAANEFFPKWVQPVRGKKWKAHYRRCVWSSEDIVAE